MGRPLTLPMEVVCLKNHFWHTENFLADNYRQKQKSGSIAKCSAIRPAQTICIDSTNDAHECMAVCLSADSLVLKHGGSEE